jgi:hypothetical protein
MSFILIFYKDFATRLDNEKCQLQGTVSLKWRKKYRKKEKTANSYNKMRF